MRREDLVLKLYRIAYILGWFLILYIIFWLLSKVALIVVLLAASILVAYVLEPAVKFFNRSVTLRIPPRIAFKKWEPIHWRRSVSWIKPGIPRVWSIAVVYLLLFSSLALLMAYVAPKVGFEFNKLAANFPSLLLQGENALDEFLQKIRPQLPPAAWTFLEGVVNRATDEIGNLGLKIFSVTLPVFYRAATMAAFLLIIPLVTFYLLLDAEHYRQAFLALFPPHRREDITLLLAGMDRALGRFVRGQLIVCVWIGVSVTIALLLWRIEYAFLIGAFAGIIDVIPYVGVVVGMVPAVALAFLKSPLTAVLVLLTLWAIHWSEGHLVVPNVVGQSVGLPPLVIIVALLIGAELGGVVGMFLAVPLASVIRVLIRHYVGKFTEEMAGREMESGSGPNEP